MPKKTKNLLVAESCRGVQRLVSGDTRVMACCYITGMVAGVDVVQAKDEDCDLRNINMGKCREDQRIWESFYLIAINKIIHE